MPHFTHTLDIQTRGPGLYEFTDDLVRFVAESRVETGLVTAFCRHTSASLLLQENADDDVKTDLLGFFRRIAPAGMDWIVHRTEGPDDMPAHIKAALTQTSMGIFPNESAGRGPYKRTGFSGAQTRLRAWIGAFRQAWQRPKACKRYRT